MQQIPLCDITSGENMVPLRKRSLAVTRVPLRKQKDLFTRESKKIKKDEDHTSDYSSQDYEMSEFERRIQRNREEKMAFLEALKMNEAKEDLKSAVLGAVAMSKPKKVAIRKVVTNKEKSSAPTRRSLRLSKTPLDLSEKAMELRALTETKEEEKILPKVLPFKESSYDEESFSHFIDDFSDLDFKEKKPCRHLDFLSNMIVEESNIAKVSRSRISALAIHPNPDKIIVCAGNKYGGLGFWNAESETMPYELTPHLKGVTCMRFHPIRRQQVITSSYDGTLRCGDIDRQVFDELYNVSDETACSYFDFFSQDTILVGQRNGRVAIVDARSERKKGEKQHSCHEYAVKSVSIHPVKKTYFFTASNKGMMSLWDLRKLQDESLMDIENQHKRSVTCAFFSPLSGNSILTTSMDDSICVFDSSDLSKISLKNSMPHDNQTGRWLTQFRATWLPNSDDAFVLGSMKQPRRIQVYNDKLGLICNLVHENLTTITSLNVFHPNRSVVAGSNSSGKVFLFTEKQVS